MARKAFKTTKFVLYVQKDSKPPKQSGTIWLTDDRHQLSLGLGGQNFNYLDEIPAGVRKLLKKYANRRKRGR